MIPPGFVSPVPPEGRPTWIQGRHTERRGSRIAVRRCLHPGVRGSGRWPNRRRRQYATVARLQPIVDRDAEVRDLRRPRCTDRTRLSRVVEIRRAARRFG